MGRPAARACAGSVGGGLIRWRRGAVTCDNGRIVVSRAELDTEASELFFEYGELVLERMTRGTAGIVASPGNLAVACAGGTPVRMRISSHN